MILKLIAFPRAKQNAPKGAKSNFMFYSLEQRPKLKEEHPELSFGRDASVRDARVLLSDPRRAPHGAWISLP